MLENYLNDETIQFKHSVENWEHAIEIASSPLIEDGSITEKYIENIVNNVKKNGPYVVIDEFFALPHAEPGEGVNKEALSLLRLNKEVDFAGKPVKAILVLAAKDSEAHLEILSKTSEILMDRGNYDILINGEEKKVRELFK